MKKYIAIGHYKNNENITCVACSARTLQDFKKDLKSNDFIPFVSITEKMLKRISALEGYDLFEQVKRMTSNYRVWEDVTEYIEQCFDIMLKRINSIDWRGSKFPV